MDTQYVSQSAVAILNQSLHAFSDFCSLAFKIFQEGIFGNFVKVKQFLLHHFVPVTIVLSNITLTIIMQKPASWLMFPSWNSFWSKFQGNLGMSWCLNCLDLTRIWSCSTPNCQIAQLQTGLNVVYVHLFLISCLIFFHREDVRKGTATKNEQTATSTSLSAMFVSSNITMSMYLLYFLCRRDELVAEPVRLNQWTANMSQKKQQLQQQQEQVQTEC